MKKVFAILAAAALALSSLGAQELTNFAFGGRGPRIVSPEVKDGKVTFRLNANYATRVQLSGNWMANPWTGVEEMKKGEGGIWEITIDAPTQDFKDPKDIFEQTLKHEEWVTEKINELADVADAEHDRASINFVDQFIDEQVEEEKTVRDILNLFRHRDGHTVATIDDIVGNVKEA